jgi:hypothetical protein
VNPCRGRLGAVALATAAALALGGCAQRSLPRLEPGPHAVAVGAATLHDAVEGRDIAVRLAAPAEPGRYPVVVFSHGAMCYPEKYAAVTDHWASWGYVVVAPNHLDSPNSRTKLTPDLLPKLLDSRIRDLTLVTDSAATLLAGANLAATPDPARMAIAGHSFGGMLTQIKMGLLLKDPRTGSALSRADARYRAALVMSGVGPMPQMAPDAFAGLRGPLLASGGTLDLGNVGSGEIFPWEWRMSAYTLAPPGDKYSLVLERGDHYLGGLICREDRGGDDDAEGAAIVRAVQVTFLDAWVRDDARERRALATLNVGALTGGRARLGRK